MNAPPNILILMADEHQARSLGAAGHPVVQTPNLDALAARGTRFTNAWTPSPICVPARAAFATGQWVHQAETWDSAQAWTGFPRGWTHALRDDGWDVTSIGKLHHRSAADDDGFSDRILPMFIAGGVGWLQGLPRRQPIPYDEASELASDVGIGETTYTRYDQRVTDAAVNWIEDRAVTRAAPVDAGAEAQPWCLFVSLVAPHYPLSAPERFYADYPLKDIPPPEIERRTEEHPAVLAMADFFDYGRWFDEEHVQRGRQAYFALCSWMDHNVGRVLGALDAAGLTKDTLVIYTSDHGEMAGNRGLWCKSFMYRDSVDIPMILAGPGVDREVSKTTAANLTDVSPTILHAAGLGAQATAGADLRTLPADDTDRLGFSEYHDGGSVTGSFAVRHGRWKYIEHVGYPPQLFDTHDDPDELHDLGVSQSHLAVRASCADALRSIVVPEEADRLAFEDQAALIDHHGGRDALAQAFRFNHTPAP